MLELKELPAEAKEYQRTKPSLGYAEGSDTKIIRGETITYLDELNRRPTVMAVKLNDNFQVETENPCKTGKQGDYIVFNEHKVLCSAKAIHFEKSYELVGVGE